MEFNYDCLWCHVNQARRIAELVNMDEAMTEKTVRAILRHISEMPYEGTNPETMMKTWQIITEIAGDKDPYKNIKKDFNGQMLEVYEALYKDVIEDKERFAKGVHLAVEGNIIDYGAKHRFTKDEIIKRLLCSELETFARDESKLLYSQLSDAEQLLYLGDNCGEIVMDKFFIEILRKEFPELKITFVVRGEVILNDVTMEDALQVGMTNVAEVIDNGSAAPGIVMKTVSDDFKIRFAAADVIIAKGQGNFESLCNLKKDNLFFLFIAKCDAVAEDRQVPLMGKLCTRS